MKKVSINYKEKTDKLADLAVEMLETIEEKTDSEPEFFMVIGLMNELVEMYCKENQIEWNLKRLRI